MESLLKTRFRFERGEAAVRRTLNLGVAIVWGLMISLAADVALADSVTAEAIYEKTGVQGGLVVHVGCGDGKLTAALHPNDRYLVQGLDTNPANVAQARQHIQQLGLYGPVSVVTFDGRQLPYVDDSVNLVVVDTKYEMQNAGSEILRVLAPRGVAVIREKENEAWLSRIPHSVSRIGNGFAMFTKPVPADVDEWGHFLHDASGNAVAQDRQVGPPKHLRWVAGPRWCRSHENPSSVNAVVTSNGRVFTIFDEAPTGVYQNLPWRCKLIARDAANGVLLWKVPMQEWQPEFGTGVGGRWNIHHTIPRRLVVQGDRVYVTLRFLHSPVSVLNAATGEVLIEALEGTVGADEMILSDNVLIVKTTNERSVAATARITRDSLDDALVAIDVTTGKTLWRKEKTRVLPYALSADNGRVIYHNMEAIVCLDARSGAEVWTVPNPIRSTLGAASTLVINDGIVLFHGHGAAPQGNDDEKANKKGKKPKPNNFYLTAFALNDGEVLWRHSGQRGQAAACTQPTDVFVTNGTVWCGGSLDGRDLRTGEVTKTVSIGELISPGHHYRCHRSKATERYLIWPKRGAEFVDVEDDHHMRNDWLRAPCFTGATPANGLLYVPPSQCFCYPGVKVFGFLAMSSGESKVQSLESRAGRKLEHGPAFGSALDSSPSTLDSSWPMYRRDSQRSGATKMVAPKKLGKRWDIELTCQGTQPVIVDDRLWVVEKDAHRVRCLSASTGQDIWSYIAGGRIDSAPTVYDGLVLFGCRDGSAYCLRAEDGALVWRFQAAPDRRQVVSFGQLESVWPVQGSVLVQDGVVYFAAGRSSFLDGGIFVYGLDAKSGRMLHNHHLEGPWPDVMTETGRPFAMEGALPDLIVSDGKDLYMQRIKFDAELNRLPTTRESDLGELDMGSDHLAATGGFLDDTGFDRLYWMYGKRWPGFYFSQQSPKAGQLVVFDDSTTYAVKYFYRRIQWSPAFFPGEQGYLLFADDNDNEPTLDEPGQSSKAIDWLPKEAATDKHRRGGRGVEKGTGYVREKPAKWQKMIPLRVRAMLLAGNRLFAVGTPDELDPDDPLAAFEGRKGARLQVFSTNDGALVESLSLPSPPAFDGLSAASGRLYLATTDAKLICFGDATVK